MAAQVLSSPAPLGLSLPSAVETPTLSQKLMSLRHVLSSGASINEATEPGFNSLSSGWSDINPIAAGAFINVATEQDVVASVPNFLLWVSDMQLTPSRSLGLP